MCRKSKRQWAGYMEIAAAVVTMAFFLSMEGIAAEDTAALSVTTSGNAIMAPDTEGEAGAISTEEEGNAAVSPITEEKDTLSVALPVIPEGGTSLFDFLLDPSGLLYETDAMRYGGGTVEAGATMFFRNGDGKNTFSRYSDKLEVTNQGETPVIVTVSAFVSDLEGIDLVGKEELSGNGKPGIYLALIDDQGKEQPISGDAKATIHVELGSGVYSFGLTGACNSGADWQEIYAHPRVTVTWHVEPVLTEEEEEPETDSLPDVNITGQEPIQEDLQKTSMDDEVSTDGKKDETTEPNGSRDESEGADLSTEKDGKQDQDSVSDVSGNQIPADVVQDHDSDQESSEAPEEGAASTDTTESSTSESNDMQEDSENPSETAETQEDTNPSENSISENTYDGLVRVPAEAGRREQG